MRGARLLVLVLVGFLWPGVAAAQDEADTATSPSPAAAAEPTPVSFVDDRPLTVKLEVLEGRGTGLRVLVHNDSAIDQVAHVQVVGLDELEGEGAETLLSDKPVEVALEPGQTKTAEIPLGTLKPRPKADSYSLLLVASGKPGPVSRRQLTISVSGAEAAGAEATDRGAALSPGAVQDVTLVAVNYAPSLLSGLTWLALAVGLLLGAGAFVVWHTDSGHPVLLVALGVAFVVLAAACGAFNGDLSSGASVHAISSRPIAVTADASPGTVGTPSSETGELARLEVAGQEMRPQGLSHAGAYKGPYDLAPDIDDKGEANATINVRDWWLYALLTVAFGVGIAYLLRRWYQRSRPAAKLATRRDKIAEAIAKAEAEFDERAAGRPYADLSIERRLRARFTSINAMIEEADPKAGEALDKLEAYLLQFKQLREGLEFLYAACQRLDRQIGEEDFGLARAEIDLLAKVEAALEVKIDSDDPDAEGTKVKEALTTVTTTQALAERAAVVHGAIACHLRSARKAAGKETDEDRKKELDAFVTAFEGFGRRLLKAEKLEEVDKIESEDDAKQSELSGLIEEDDVDGTIVFDSGDAIADVMRARFVTGEQRFYAAALEGELDFTLPEIEVDFEVRGAPERSSRVVHKNDDVVVQISMASGRGLGFTGFAVDFGDGEPVHVLVPPGQGPVELLVSRQVTGASDRTIAVTTFPDGREVKSIPITVQPRTRLEASEAAFERNERLINRLSFVLAVASGLAALYLTDAAWGTPEDYLKALLWGGFAAEGVKLVVALADRTGPAT